MTALPTTDTGSHRWWRRCLAVVALSAVTVVGLEGLLIIADTWLVAGPYVYDRALGARYRPRQDGANRFGFNDVERPLHKPQGVFRLLVLGDSFSWAGGTSGNYIPRLERAFEEHYGAHVVDIVNAGYPGTHTGEQLQLLKAIGLQFDPDAVVLGFFAGNDFHDAGPSRRRVAVNGLYVDLNTQYDFETALWGRPLVSRSRLALLTWYTWQRVRETWRRPSAADVALLSEQSYLDTKRAYLRFYHRPTYQQGTYARHVELIFTSVSAMRQVLAARRIPLLVAILPDELSVDPTVSQLVFSRFQLDPSEYDLTLPQQILEQYLAAEGIPFVDLTVAFRTGQPHHPLYLPRDGHWNDAGNALAAEALFPPLLRFVKEHSTNADGRLMAGR